jgi:uncharacterized membrane protein
MAAMSARHRVTLLLMILAAFALRLYRLGAQSLWYDETVSAVLASKSLPALVMHTAGDIHPPGYYVLLHLWMRLVGSSEYSLAFLSLVFSILIVVLVFALTKAMLGARAALWATALTAMSPFQIWYAQEVRMYTLGATAGLMSLWFAWNLLYRWRATNDCVNDSRGTLWEWGLGYAVAAAVGLYVLYYFAFWLIFLAALPALWLLFNRRWRQLTAWLGLQVAVAGLYLPWLPISWRQATSPPVPPWRGLAPWDQIAMESWSAMSLGQSVHPGQAWPILVLTLILYLVGLVAAYRLGSGSGRSNGLPTWVLLLSLTVGPIMSIGLLSLVTPLYHVRYVFTYSAPFYIILGAGFAWLWGRRRAMVWICTALLMGGSALSLYQMHTHPAYEADDFRSAVAFLAERWRPGDAILVNAGYAYTAFIYYYSGDYIGPVRLTEDWPAPASEPLVLQMGIIGGDADLGWGRRDSDFFAISTEEAVAGLSRLNREFERVWVLRAYDTVADPEGVVRTWLEDHMLLFEDHTFAGEAYVHVSGFLSGSQSPPPAMDAVSLDGGVTVLGWDVPASASVGDCVDVVLWLEVSEGSASAQRPMALSLKLWGIDEGGSGDEPYLAAQRDAWPVGNHLLTSEWEPGVAMRYPMRLDLPDSLDSGTYWLNVEVYDPVTLVPWPLQDGSGASVPLSSLQIEVD